MKFSAIICLSATTLLAGSVDAFTVISTAAPKFRSMGLSSTVSQDADTFYYVEEPPVSGEYPQSLLISEQRRKPAPQRPKKPVHKSDGIFAPLVLLAKKVMGEEKLIQFRAKVIAKHSDVIKGFVDTSDSEFGQFVLDTLFQMADQDKNGAIDMDEFRDAMRALGFNHLKDKQLDGIFSRADKDDNGTLDIEEFKSEAPKTLKANLIKLAKSNGDELGFLA